MCKISDTPPASPSCNGKSIAVGMATATAPAMPEEEHERNSRKRRVSFGSDVEHVFERDFTPDDMCHIWYNGEEFMEMKSEIYALVRYVNERAMQQIQGCGMLDDNDDDDVHYWRGFEHIKQKRPRKEIRRKHVSDLLYFHKVMSVDDPVGLSLMAISNSREAMERARQLAIVDESEALEIYNEDDDMDMVDMDSLSSSFSSLEDSTAGMKATTKTRKAATERGTPIDVDDDKAITPVAMMSICRGEEDSKTVRLLHDNTTNNNNNLPPVAPVVDEDVLLSLLLFPYKMALLILPCIC